MFPLSTLRGDGETVMKQLDFASIMVISDFEYVTTLSYFKTTFVDVSSLSQHFTCWSVCSCAAAAVELAGDNKL